MIRLYRGDCLELLPSIDSGSVDMVLCDLPYGVLDCRWDKQIPLAPLWEQWRRVTKSNAAIVLFAAQPFATRLINSNPRWFRYEWIWDKRSITGFGNARRMPLRRHENVLVFYRALPTYHPQGVRRIPPAHRASRGLTCAGNYDTRRSYVRRLTGFPHSIIEFPRSPRIQAGSKPAELCEYLVRTYTHEGETVLDSCMGLGSAGVACVRSGRRFVGIELDPQRFDSARQAIAAAQAG